MDQNGINCNSGETKMEQRTFEIISTMEIPIIKTKQTKPQKEMMIFCTETVAI
jgi:hypothetical protein